MTVYDVVNKLIGPIRPLGETNEDNRRFENLQRMAELVDLLVADIDQIVYENRNYKQFSIKRAVEFSDNFLTKKLGISE